MKPITSETSGNTKVLLLGLIVDLLRVARAIEYFNSDPELKAKLATKAKSIIAAADLSIGEVGDLCYAAGNRNLVALLA